MTVKGPLSVGIRPSGQRRRTLRCWLLGCRPVWANFSAVWMVRVGQRGDRRDRGSWRALVDDYPGLVCSRCGSYWARPTVLRLAGDWRIGTLRIDCVDQTRYATDVPFPVGLS